MAGWHSCAVSWAVTDSLPWWAPPTFLRLLQLCFSPNNDLLVSGGYDQAVKVWDCRSRSIDAIQVLKGFRDSVTSVATTER